jgi:hypothetical protein
VIHYLSAHRHEENTKSHEHEDTPLWNTFLVHLVLASIALVAVILLLNGWFYWRESTPPGSEGHWLGLR